MKKKLISEKELCENLGISRMTAYRLREKGKISYCRIGNKVKYRPEHIDEFLDDCENRTDK